MALPLPDKGHLVLIYVGVGGEKGFCNMTLKVERLAGEEGVSLCFSKSFSCQT